MKKDVWQRHHILYLDKDGVEKTVMVTRSEHFYLTRVNFFKELSAGFRQAMRYILRTKPMKVKQ
jgi:hypothetical protein